MAATIDDALIRGVRDFLGDEGLEFFRGLVRHHGRVDAVLVDGDGSVRVPHIVHFREGMRVRNRMRELTCHAWTAREYDELWAEVVERAIRA